MRAYLVGMALALSISNSAFSQPAGDILAMAAPFVDDQVVAILRLDLGRFDANAAAKRWATLVGAEELQTDMRSLLTDQIGQLNASGATMIYAVWRLEDSIPVILVSHEAGRNPAKVLALLKSIVRRDNLAAEERGNIWVFGMPATLKKLKSLQPTARPDLVAGLAEGKDAEVCLAMAFGGDIRRAVEETMPNFPPAAGGGPVTTLTRGMKWLSWRVKTAPKLDAQMTVQASDADSAKRLNEVWQSLTKAMAIPSGNESKELAVLHAATTMSIAQVIGDKLAIRMDEATMARDIASLTSRVQLAAHRTKSQNNLRQLALAMHSYHDANNGKFPTDIYDKQGKPLLSWRVQLLPYIEAGNIAQSIRMNEPWDSEHNKQFLAQIPAQFVAPRQKSPAGTTTYRSTSGEQFMFAPQPNGPARGIRDMVDGTSQTIMIVEAADEVAVPWTKPGDLTPTQKDPMTGLLGHYADGFYVALGDGSSIFIRKDISLKDLFAMFTINGNEVIEYYNKR